MCAGGEETVREMYTDRLGLTRGCQWSGRLVGLSLRHRRQVCHDKVEY